MRELRIAGLDEAGRGCVIGPMAIAGVLVDEDGLARLVEIGVRDSKTLEPEARERLAEQIKSIALAYRVVLVEPREIDRAVATGGLNKLEARVMASIIRELGPDVAYVDASDVLEGRFALVISSFLPPEHGVQVVAEHKADAKYPVVSAASILAKVERDKAISRLKAELGVDFGSGYPTDPRTIGFLRSWYEEHASFPPFVRRTWRTAREIALELGARRLDEWGEQGGK